MKKCLRPKCKIFTKNPKYCSKSCSAKHTNVIYPKRKTKNKCIVCKDDVISYRYTRCQKHHNEYIKYKKEQKYQTKSLGEYRNKISVKGKHPSWVNSHIRLFNRSWNKDKTKLPCANCSYKLHVELCHIKPIASFPDTSLLSEVNSPSNVVQLCRNCHWELDNNYLFVEVTKIGKFIFYSNK